MSAASPFTFYEFFAGGGMARVGLGEGWRCLFANDFDAGKGRAYAANFGDDHLRVGDVWALSPADLPGRPDLAWASSPCQDLSLAGARAGLEGRRSSAFWGFWRLVEALGREGRAPRAVVIENVTGLLTSRGGADFAALCDALAQAGYRFGAVTADAALWLPQSRPRVFIVATREAAPAGRFDPESPFHSGLVARAFEALPETLKPSWIWWGLQAPAARNSDLAAVLEPDDAVEWSDDAATERLVELMSPLHRQRLAAIRAEGGRRVGAVYRRVRVEKGVRVQRAEARFDGLAGCLRTPAGGSSRQIVLVVDKGRVRSRLLTPREAARLMGLPDDYRLPEGRTRALKVAGDGVAAPVVRVLAQQILEPLLTGAKAEAA
jgi:DNA (cytosine-5)-methyltransferase 1